MASAEKKNLTEDEIKEVRKNIIAALKKPYADTEPFTVLAEELPLNLKKFYSRDAADRRAVLGITDVIGFADLESGDPVEILGYNFATLAAGNGYHYLMPVFKKFDVDLTKASPNGTTPAGAAGKKHLREVLGELEKLGIDVRGYACIATTPYPHPI